MRRLGVLSPSGYRSAEFFLSFPQFGYVCVHLYCCCCPLFGTAGVTMGRVPPLGRSHSPQCENHAQLRNNNNNNCVVVVVCSSKINFRNEINFSCILDFV